MAKNDKKQQVGIHNGHVPPKEIAQLHEFYLSGYIGAPEVYVDWFNVIRHASDEDTVKIYINSCGGDLFTAIQFLRVLSETNATVICSVEGACMSAATLVFLNADIFEVTPHSVFMFHNYSGGTWGKGGEQFDQIIHERKWSEKLLFAVYDTFLTKDEITSLLHNKDIWLDTQEVIERMQKRIEAKKEAETSTTE